MFVSASKAACVRGARSVLAGVLPSRSMASLAKLEYADPLMLGNTLTEDEKMIMVGFARRNSIVLSVIHCDKGRFSLR
jgi:hypothetical protein